MSDMPTQTRQEQTDVLLERISNLKTDIGRLEKKVDETQKKLDESYVTGKEFETYKADNDRRTASLEETRRWLGYTVIGFVVVGILGYFFLFNRGTL